MDISAMPAEKPPEECVTKNSADRLIGLENGGKNVSSSTKLDTLTLFPAVLLGMDISTMSAERPPEECATKNSADRLIDLENGGKNVSSSTLETTIIDAKRSVKVATRKGPTNIIDITDLPPSTTHRLTSNDKGESEVEYLARDIEDRRNSRIPVPFHIKQRLLLTLKQISEEKDYPRRSAVKVSDLRELRDKVEKTVSRGDNFPLYAKVCEALRFRNSERTALKVLNKAVEVVDDMEERDDSMWHYTDFMFYYTENEAYFPWFRHPLSAALFWTFFFYVGTPILFCLIYHDDGICPSDPTSQDRRYYGVVSSLYFASATMSTVGYGDLSVSKDERWKVFLGTCYMILALLVAVTSFAAIIESSFNEYKGVFEGFLHKMAQFFGELCGKRPKKEMLLYERIRLLKYVKIGDVAVQFTILNLIGVFASRFFVNADPHMDWTWMDSFYWSVQTTTTIGYGDMYMNFSMRWFQLFYLVIATYFVGYALGKLGDLSSELMQTKRRYAWERRETDRAMVENMQGGKDHDGRVDQFEFVVASLLLMNKIDSSDIGIIMDKFRQLADDTGFIHIDDAPVNGDGIGQPFDEEEVFEVEALDAEGNYQGVIQRAINRQRSFRAL